MEKRVILAFVLSFVVLFAFRTLYSPPPSITEPVVPPSDTQTVPPPSKTPPVAIPPAEKNEALPAEDVRADKAEDFVIDTPLYAATISNIGGVLTSYKLKDYRDGEGKPLELIDQKAGAKVG